MDKRDLEIIIKGLNEAYADTAGNEHERTGCAIAIEYLSDALFRADPSFDGKRFNALAKNLTTVER